MYVIIAHAVMVSALLQDSISLVVDWAGSSVEP